VEHPDLSVRVGTPADLDDVMELAQLVASENAIVPPNHLKILERIYPALHRDNGLIGIVGPHGGAAQGFALLWVSPPWYGDERIIEECGIYVHPDWRAQRGGRASLLYKFCKQVADQMSVKLVVGVLSAHRTESKVRYYERFFGPQAGAYYIYNPLAAMSAAAIAAE
jgi:GNAT superfamily N-acetyltransferase